MPENITGDPRDGEEASPFTEDEDEVQVIAERQLGKRPQSTQEKLVDRAQPIAPPSDSDIAAVLAALKQTNVMLQRQNLRIEALERNQRHPRTNSRSPTRRHHRSATPPPRNTNNQRRPPLERLQQPTRKRDRTPPPREDRISPTT
ncbi:hypothetical protein A2U01_0051570, partial [Trifolium medium]|nr:hypothetical protein [Trifolium medium]